MKEINNISHLKKGKIYYIHVKDFARPNMKLRGKYGGDDENKKFVYFKQLEYINHHYNKLQFPNAKPIYLKLWKVNGKLYRFISETMVEQIKEFPDLYERCKIFEPEKERILVNFVMRNKIINDPYFDYRF